MLTFENVKPNIFDSDILVLLTPSVFKPTPERLKARAEKYINNPNVQIFACRNGGKYVGIAVVEIIGKTATVLDIAVNETCRNKGYGSALLSFLLENFDIKTMTAETDDDAVGFYQKFGFKTVKTKTVYDTKRYVLNYTK